jgi:enoyl-CoA hydratase/carnithine racemase
MTEHIYSTLRYEVFGIEGRITLARPEARNAITYQMALELEEALLKAKADQDVRVVVLTGDGPAFCAGIDLYDHREKGPAAFRELLEQLYWRLQYVHTNLGKPTVAALNGPARAAGCTMAFMCDMIVAKRSASLGLPEVTLGLLPAYHLAYLPRIIGKAKAFELTFSGDPIDVDEAERLGIVNAVIDDDQWTEGLSRFVGRFAVGSPRTMKIGKDAFYRVMDMEFGKAIADAADAVVVLGTTPDTREGLDAYAERRDPAWVVKTEA